MSYTTQAATDVDFRSVEDIFARLLCEYPNPIVLPCPPGITPETFANKLRATARRFLFHKWHSVVELDRFASLWPTVAVSVGPDSVTIGPRTKIRAGEVPAPRHGLVVPGGPVDPRTLDALIHLHHIELLRASTHFPDMSVAEADEIRKRLIEERRNVAIGPHQDKGWKMI